MTARNLLRCLAVVWMPAVVWAAGPAKKGDDSWVIENQRIRVTVDPAAGSITVLDKVSNYEWRQPGAKATALTARVTVPMSPKAPAIDGDPSEWQGAPTTRLTSQMTAHAKKVDSNDDCSADIWVSWDAANLYLAARVKDDLLKFGPTGFETWWERDALELWVNALQVGLNLNPNGSQARIGDGVLQDARVVVRPGEGSYMVEACLPWKSLGVRPTPGVRFRFAVGVNDADATESREGQLYFPVTWVHSDPAAFAEAALADEKGGVPSAAPSPGAKFRNVREIQGQPGIAFEADFGATKGKPNTVTVSLRAPDRSSDVVIEADMTDRNAEVTGFSFLPPLLLDSPKGVLAVADYSNGHLYPLDQKPFPRGSFGADRLDMAWVGVCDMEKGMGYALILDTSDDAWVRCGQHPVGDRQVAAPEVGWHPSKGRFAYPRRIIYHFAPSGGYVALAKAYRTYAKAKGLIVPFSDKLKKNPNIERLFGAPDVWGDAGLAFARQAKAAGVDKMLIHGRPSPEDMKAINELGYLTSEYDNYTDILPVEQGKEVDSSHDILPDHAVLKADGKRMTAWLTWDKKTQYMKRCPAFWVPTARLVIPKVLEKWPFVGRFIDVTTAEGLYECSDEKHPLTKEQKRQCGVDLLSCVRSQKLVVGGEHGIWWGVPVQDYIEGMMSGGYASWPAGHLIHPKSKDEEFASPWGGKLGGAKGWEAYAKWGIGHEWRAPLWELVFHDCIVTTWYWGDASDWLLQAAPEITPKKDAFNILYATIPLLWANRDGSWQAAREVFLRTYRNTCKLHEVVAGAEMLSHEFVTPDHAVQRTQFSDDTQVIVNFGEKPYTAELGGRKHVLPQNGFAVIGPRIEQSLELVDGKPVTTIRGEGYLFTDAGGVEVAARSMGDEQLRLNIGASKERILFRPSDVVPTWDMAGTRAFRLDAKGDRVGHIDWRSEKGGMSLGAFAEPVTLDVLCRAKAQLPDVWLAPAEVSVSPAAPRQGENVEVSVVLHNGGGCAAKGVGLAFFADQVQPDRRLARHEISIEPGEKRAITVGIDTSAMDGSRRILAVVDPEEKVAELCERNNMASKAIEITPDFSRWPNRRALRVETGAIERENDPVILPMELPGADPASVRVVECDEGGNPKVEAPAQFDAGADGRGELCFLLPGKTPAGATRQFLLLWAGTGKSTFLSPSSTIWNAVDSAVEGETYRMEFHEGTPVNLAARSRQGAAGKPFISMLILSSKGTGWGDEPGKVERFEVVHAGPVRTTIAVRKALKAGVVYDKSYAFYPKRFDVTISVNKPAGGLYSRAYYLQPGEYVNDQGLRAKVDGKGDGEEVYGKGKNPKWYAVYGTPAHAGAEGWAHACVALSPFDHVAYWDSGQWGGIGLVTGATKDIKMSYVICAGAKDATFAEDAHRRLTNPVKVESSRSSGH